MVKGGYSCSGQDFFKREHEQSQLVESRNLAKDTYMSYRDIYLLSSFI